ncbi:carboxymuconolactone decarboxylase family protein [Nocardia sp. CA-119907]|uniref:carboxymuconolactone decarboxylase family protein n=1 Tax=Nocardia sp. CA-119907 TaxID=3239973 RepID=UPI003D977454
MTESQKTCHPHRSDRLPPLPDQDLSAEQRTAVQRISSGPRRGVIGPFIPLLRSPAAMEHLQGLGAYLRFESSVPRALFEMSVLLTARAHDQEFEWNYHAPLARQAGLAEAIVESIARRETPSEMSAAEAAVFYLVSESLYRNEVSEQTYRNAVDQLGIQAAIDVVVATGYYSTLAMVMNFAQTPSCTPMPDAITLDR